MGKEQGVGSRAGDFDRDVDTRALIELLERSSAEERGALSSVLHRGKRHADESPEGLAEAICLTGAPRVSGVLGARRPSYGRIVLGMYRRFRLRQVAASKAGIPGWIPGGEALDRPPPKSARGIGDFDPDNVVDAEARIVSHVFSLIVEAMSAGQRRDYEAELASIAVSCGIPYAGLGVAGEHIVIAGDADHAGRLTALAVFHGVGLAGRSLLPITAHRRKALSLELTPFAWAWHRCRTRCATVFRNRRFEKTVASIAWVRALRYRLGGAT